GQLSEVQRNRWKEMTGAPFQWEDTAAPVPPASLRRIEYKLRLGYDRQGLCSKCNPEPRLVYDERVQKELKLTAEQVARLKKTEDGINDRHKDALEKLEKEE